MNGYPITCEWDLVTGPTQEPISVDEAKRQARITTDDELVLMTSYIKTAREAAEQFLGRGLFTQTWKLTLSDFADVMWLPMAAPLQSVTNVKYYDENGALQTLSTSYYTVDTVCRPGKVVKAPNQSWPSVQSDRRSSAVEITYVVGWTNVALIPERIKQGIRLWVAYLHMDREGVGADRFGTGDAERARAAAEACWTDRVFWKEPVYCGYEG